MKKRLYAVCLQRSGQDMTTEVVEATGIAGAIDQVVRDENAYEWVLVKSEKAEPRLSQSQRSRASKAKRRQRAAGVEPGLPSSILDAYAMAIAEGVREEQP